MGYSPWGCRVRYCLATEQHLTDVTHFSFLHFILFRFSDIWLYYRLVYSCPSLFFNLFGGILFNILHETLKNKPKQIFFFSQLYGRIQNSIILHSPPLFSGNSLSTVDYTS